MFVKIILFYCFCEILSEHEITEHNVLFHCLHILVDIMHQNGLNVCLFLNTMSCFFRLLLRFPPRMQFSVGPPPTGAVMTAPHLHQDPVGRAAQTHPTIVRE